MSRLRQHLAVTVSLLWNVETVHEYKNNRSSLLFCANTDQSTGYHPFHTLTIYHRMYKLPVAVATLSKLQSVPEL